MIRRNTVPDPLPTAPVATRDDATARGDVTASDDVAPRDGGVSADG